MTYLMRSWGVRAATVAVSMLFLNLNDAQTAGQLAKFDGSGNPTDSVASEISGQIHVPGNGADVVIGDPNCSPGSQTVAIGFLTGANLDCGQNFNLGASTLGNGQTVINRPTGGSISFREGNGADQMTISPGGQVHMGPDQHGNTGQLTVAVDGTYPALYLYGSSDGYPTLVARSTPFGIAGRFLGEVSVDGFLQVDSLGSQGTVPLCWNATPGDYHLATCSSSLRYKTDVRPFAGGMDIVNRLRPISFNWKQDGTPDIGLGAEDVEQIEPLLTFRNDKGEIEGVKYNQLSAVFVNAFLEQKAEIQQLHEQIKQQQGALEALKALVCSAHSDKGVCQ